MSLDPWHQNTISSFIHVYIACNCTPYKELFFSDSEFFRTIQLQRNTSGDHFLAVEFIWRQSISNLSRFCFLFRLESELVIGSWAPGPRPQLKQREMTYQMALNYAIGPKQTLVIEKQVRSWSVLVLAFSTRRTYLQQRARVSMEALLRGDDSSFIFKTLLKQFEVFPSRPTECHVIIGTVDTPK
jgi:hypothetical protein